MPTMFFWQISRHIVTTVITTAAPILRRTSGDAPDNNVFSLLAQADLPDNIAWWVVVLVANLLYIVPLCIFVSLQAATNLTTR